MAILTCPDCQTQIDPRDKTCPHCGRLNMTITQIKKPKPVVDQQKPEPIPSIPSLGKIIYRNPANGYEECGFTDSSPIWAFILGPLYWVFRGVWSHALLSICISPLYCSYISLYLLYLSIIDNNVLLVGWLAGIFDYLFLSALCAFFVSHCIYPFFTFKILRSYYGRKGWIEITDNNIE